MNDTIIYDIRSICGELERAMGVRLYTSPVHIKVSKEAGALASSSAAPARTGVHQLLQLAQRRQLSQFPGVRQTRTLRDSLNIIQGRTQPVRTCDVFLAVIRGIPWVVGRAVYGVGLSACCYQSRGPPSSYLKRTGRGTGEWARGGSQTVQYGLGSLGWARHR